MPVRMPARSVCAYLAGTALLAASVVFAQALSPADTVEARQSAYREIGTAYKSINDELKKGSPVKFIMGSSARLIATNLRQIGPLFPPGSGPELGVEMKARPEIWTDRATFDSAYNTALKEAEKLVTVMGSGDLAAIRAQARALGRSCKSCHEDFRVED
jgi:cytochrome c556